MLDIFAQFMGYIYTLYDQKMDYIVTKYRLDYTYTPTCTNGIQSLSFTPAFLRIFCVDL
jgi:hypothetical protein